MIVASILLAIQLDPSTGLWFPPYATRTQYLNRDPAHPYMRDVERAFSETPALVNDVCGAYLAAPEPQTAEVHDPSVRQFRAMLAMACTGRHAQATRRQEAATRQANAVSLLQTQFEEEERAVANVPRKERDQRARDLISGIDETAPSSLRPSLRAIALSPSDSSAIHALMLLPQTAPFLEQLYRSRDGSEWKEGLPVVLLFEGKLEDARNAARDSLAISAVISRALGQEGAFDRMPETVIDSATMLVINALDIQREHAPRGLVDAAFDLDRRNGDDWPAQLTLIGNAAFAAPREAEKRFYELLANRDMPPAARSDATYYLMKIAAAHEPARVAPLVDCWLASRGVGVPAATAMTWKQLAAMPPGSGAPTESCAGSSASSFCVLHALGMRGDAAKATKQWAVAKQTIEKMAAITVENHLIPDVVRNELKELAQFDTEDAAAINRYLASSAPQPWETPVAVNLPPANCP